MNPHLYPNLLNNSIIKVVFLNICVFGENEHQTTQRHS